MKIITLVIIGLLLGGCSAWGPYDLLARGYMSALTVAMDRPDPAATMETHWAQMQTGIDQTACESRAVQAWHKAEWSWQAGSIERFRHYTANRTSIDTELRAKKDAAVQACRQ